MECWKCQKCRGKVDGADPGRDHTLKISSLMCGRDAGSEVRIQAVGQAEGRNLN